jgi:hypothetical protein
MLLVSLASPSDTDRYISLFYAESSYTPLPASILARNTRPPHILLPAAASLFTPGSSAMAAYIEANNGSTTTPDEHLTCIDGVYFATDAEGTLASLSDLLSKRAIGDPQLIPLVSTSTSRSGRSRSMESS